MKLKLKIVDQNFDKNSANGNYLFLQYPYTEDSGKVKN